MSISAPWPKCGLCGTAIHPGYTCEQWFDMGQKWPEDDEYKEE